MNLIKVVRTLRVTLVAMASCSAALAGTQVDVWELPKGDIRPETRGGWKPAAAKASPKGGLAIENKSLLLLAQPGQPGAVLYHKTVSTNKRAEIALVAATAQGAAAIGKVELVKSDDDEAIIRVSAGGTDMELVLGAGKIFVSARPGRNAASIEVRSGARYALLPDFFSDDVVFDPVKFTVPKLNVPAENFLLQFVEGGDTIVMCTWQGNLRLPAAKAAVAPPAPVVPVPAMAFETFPKVEDAYPGPLLPGSAPVAPAPKVEKDGFEPQVDLYFAGEGKVRRIGAARIEFGGKPVHVGIMEQKGLWQDEDVSALAGYKSTALAWKRPFEAKWRGDFLLADGKSMADWPTRQQSFEFLSTADPKKNKWWYSGDENSPIIWQESLTSGFVYPAIQKSDEMRLCLYVDKGERGKADRATSEARKTDPKAPAVPYTNVYERVIIYPLDRTAATPLTSFTPVDLMRDTLGEGPCEYVLDISGVKPRPLGGDRPILSYATCGLWDVHIGPIIRQFKKKADGSYEPLTEKDQAHLIQALEDMWHFVHAIHDRLREYKQWGADTAAFCQKQSSENPKVKPLADRAMAYIDRLNNDIKNHRFEGPESEAFWKDRIPQLIAMVRENKYAEIGTVERIRNLGNVQDERVSRCRQYVKGARQEILLTETSDPDVRKFAAELRDRCHSMLRNMHPKEGF